MVSNNPWNQQKLSLGPAYLINAPIYEAPCSHTLLQICGSHPKLEISALESSPVSIELLFSESLQRFLWWPSYCSVSPVNFLFGITECKTPPPPPPLLSITHGYFSTWLLGKTEGVLSLHWVLSLSHSVAVLPFLQSESSQMGTRWHTWCFSVIGLALMCVILSWVKAKSLITWHDLIIHTSLLSLLFLSTLWCCCQTI